MLLCLLSYVYSIDALMAQDSTMLSERGFTMKIGVGQVVFSSYVK